MKRLFFKKPYMQLIREGKKTSTIRLHTTLKVGDEVLFLSGPDSMVAKITSVEKILYAELTDEIAQTDGFETEGDLIHALRQLYPKEVIGSVFYIKFTL